MKVITCCTVALLAVALMVSTAGAYEDEIPTFQSVYGQPPVSAAGGWFRYPDSFVFPPSIDVTQTEVLLTGPWNATPQIVRFDRRTGNAIGPVPLYSWWIGELQPDWPPEGLLGLGPFHLPVAVAGAPNGILYAADYDWAALTLYTSDGTFMGEWGPHGLPVFPGVQPLFSHPSSVCTTPDSSVYVLDLALARIKHFSPDGHYVGEWSTPDPPERACVCPMSVSGANDDGVWLLNEILYWNGVNEWRVHHYGPDGTELTSWPVTDGPILPAYAKVDADAEGNVWVLGANGLRRFSPDGRVLAQIPTTARNFAVSPDDLLWLLVPQTVADEYSDYVDNETGHYALETRDFAGNLVQSMGDPQDLVARGVLNGVQAFAGTPAGDSYALATNYPTDSPVSYISHFGPDGVLLEVLPPAGVPVYNPVTGAVDFVPGFPVEGVGPDGCYYAVGDSAIESGDGTGDPSTWPGHVTIQRSHGDGSAPELFTVDFPAGIANASTVANRPALAFGADGNFRVLVQGYGPLEGAPYPTHGPGPIWVATVTPQGETVSAWTAQPAPGLRMAASMVVDPAGDVYVGGVGGVWKYTAAGELVGRIGAFGVPDDPREQTRIGDAWLMQLDAQGVLRVCDNSVGRIFTFAYPAGPFPDVPWWSWCRDPVRWLVSAGIANGYPDGNYHPEYAVTRDQMAVYLARVAYGGDVNVPSGPAAPSFSDVPTGYWAYKYIEACKAIGTVTGYGSEYRPAQPVDRAQMAAFVHRMFPWGFMDPDSGPHFADVPEDHWAYLEIEYCLQNGIVHGYPDGLYHPEQIVTRDQMAVFMHRGPQIPLP
jgi:hypothetical protein